MEASSAETHFVGNDDLRTRAPAARAMQIRWRWPPENSWGKSDPPCPGSRPDAPQELSGHDAPAPPVRASQRPLARRAARQSPNPPAHGEDRDWRTGPETPSGSCWRTWRKFALASSAANVLAPRGPPEPRSSGSMTPHQRPPHRRLAATGFPHHGQCLASPQRRKRPGRRREWMPRCHAAQECPLREVEALDKSPRTLRSSGLLLRGRVTAALTGRPNGTPSWRAVNPSGKRTGRRASCPGHVAEHAAPR